MDKEWLLRREKMVELVLDLQHFNISRTTELFHFLSVFPLTTPPTPSAKRFFAFFKLIPKQPCELLEFRPNTRPHDTMQNIHMFKIVFSLIIPLSVN